jgi:hypothetical protein
MLVYQKSIDRQSTFRRNMSLATCFMLVYCLAYSSNLKMEATSSSETSVDFQPTARLHIPVDSTLYCSCFRIVNIIICIQLNFMRVYNLRPLDILLIADGCDPPQMIRWPPFWQCSPQEISNYCVGTMSPHNMITDQTLLGTHTHTHMDIMAYFCRNATKNMFRISAQRISLQNLRRK